MDKPKKSDRTRAAILDAAKELFAEVGYERATVRDVAARASIDAAMVIRYFGSKEQLFAQATEFNLKLPEVRNVSPDQLGQAVIRHFLAIWEGPQSNGSLTILLRTSASNEVAATRVREIFGKQVLPMLSTVVDREELAARVGLISSQLLGLALCRYVLKVPPVVAMTPDLIIQAVGPTLQRYINGPLS